MEVRGFSVAPTIPGVTEDEPVVYDTEMDSEHVADIETAEATVHKATTESRSGCSSATTSGNTFTTIGTAGSLMSLESAESMNTRLSKKSCCCRRCKLVCCPFNF